MSNAQERASPMEVTVENVGGIDDTRVELQPGVTVLTGRNATNRTSFLLAIMTALGADRTPLKADAQAGRVELTIDDETFTRTLTRSNGGVTTGGDPYLSDPHLASQFAFLLEDNPARRAVERGDDLRDIIMDPVDTEAIEERINELVSDKLDLQQELETLESLEDERTSLVSKRTTLESNIAETRDALEQKQAEIEAADADLEESREEKTELEDRFSELQDARSRLDDVRYSLETERESLASLREERTDLAAELDDLPTSFDGDIDTTERQIERLRGQKSQIDTQINQLKGIIQFNEEQLDGDAEIPLDAPENQGDTAVTDQLVEEQPVTCWTCGTVVEGSQIESTLDQLRDLRAEQFERRNEIESEIEELESKLGEYREHRDRRDEIQNKLDTIETEIDQRNTQIETLAERREELETEIDELETAVDELQDESYDDVLDLHREANQLELELSRYEDEKAEVETRLADIDDRLAERNDLKRRRDEIQSELTELRTRVDRIEQSAVEEFNTHMQNVIETLEYGNIERIWIERTETEVQNGRRKVSKSSFDLHLVRSTEDGTTYEDTVDHLSESEREVTGLVFALAGYLVHEVYEKVPFLVIDSLEAIDSNRIATFVEYLSEYASNLVVALLPEDAEPLSADHHYVTEI